MADSELNEIKNVMNGLDLYWYSDRRIVKYVISAVNATLLDTWSQAVIDILKEWPDGQPYLALHDLSDRGVSMSYAAQVKFNMLNLAIRTNAIDKVKQILDKKQEFNARVALLFNSYHSGYVGQFMARQGRNPLLNVDYDMFYEEAGAFQWLSEGLRESNEENGG